MTVKKNLTPLLLSISLMISGCGKDNGKPEDSCANKGLTTLIFNTSKPYGTMTDQDGNVYKTITIGTQTWMAENLRTTKYRDGSAIPKVTGNVAWTALSTGAYCTYHNTTKADSITTFGRLYNGYAVKSSRKIAPAGWHVPTDAEWTELTTYLGGQSLAGGKMKETCTTHWLTTNTGATNESGFTSLPSGYRFFNVGKFYAVGSTAYYWSSTSYTMDGRILVYYRSLSNSLATVGYGSHWMTNGYAVRLVRD